MKERIITGVIIAFIAIMSIFYLPTQWFSVALILIGLVGGYEWTKMMSLTRSGAFIFLSLLFLLMSVFTVCLGFDVLIMHEEIIGLGGFEFGLLFSLLLSVFWLTMPFILRRYAQKGMPFLTQKAVLLCVSMLTVFGFFVGILMLHYVNPGYVFLLVLLVAGADSMAYFVGRKIGKHKLAPTISPGKSIEGACAGIVSGVLIGLIASFFIDMSILQRFGFMVLCGVMVIISICGDLFESLVKRFAGLKDSGNILPGHGGVLDRIDALTAAAPLFVCGLCGLFLLGIQG